MGTTTPSGESPARTLGPEPAERPFWKAAGKAQAFIAPEVSNLAGPAMAAHCGRRFRWWRWSWSSATGELHCPYCGLGWNRWGPPQSSEQIEWEVRLFRRRTVRTKYRRPAGCQCQPQRPDILSAPLAPALIPKGLLASSFLTEVLVLKFLYHVPLERIRAMARSAGLALSAGTLCGALEKITPLFAPLYEAIQAESRQAPLCLIDETRSRSLCRPAEQRQPSLVALGGGYSPDPALHCRPLALGRRAQSLFWLPARRGSLPLRADGGRRSL
jgi:transposase